MPDDPVDILLVEDDPNDLRLALLALREERIGNNIQVARDGEEALDFLFCQGPHNGRNPKKNPQLILLDLKLPKINGLEVLAKIRASPQTKSLPVVVLTSSKQDEDVLKGYELGVNSFVQKPVDFDQFRKTVKELGYYWMVVNQPPRMADGH